MLQGDPMSMFAHNLVQYQLLKPVMQAYPHATPRAFADDVQVSGDMVHVGPAFQAIRQSYAAAGQVINGDKSVMYQPHPGLDAAADAAVASFRELHSIPKQLTPASRGITFAGVPHGTPEYLEAAVDGAAAGDGGRPSGC